MLLSCSGIMIKIYWTTGFPGMWQVTSWRWWYLHWRVIWPSGDRYGRSFSTKLVGLWCDNLVDDRGMKRVITKRMIDSLELIPSSTACTLLLTYGNAEGKLASLHVVYKAEKLLTMTEKGPENRRASHKICIVWLHCFEDWFASFQLPLLKEERGGRLWQSPRSYHWTQPKFLYGSESKWC
jgi:hypothetical protein